MWQALCYTGRGFDTCWRPGSVAARIVVHHMPFGGDYCPVHLHR